MHWLNSLLTLIFDISEKMRTYYTGSELEYAYFIHSACVVGKLLCFSNGRKFFPIKLRDSDGRCFVVLYLPLIMS